MSAGPASGIPAKGPGRGGAGRGYSWPPYEPGNVAALRHGAYSDRKTDELARQLVDGLLADRPLLGSYPEAVWAWARAEARCLLLDAYLVEHGLLDEHGSERPAARAAARFEAAAQRLRERLGLDPRADLDLAKSRAEAVHARVDLEAVIAAGRAALARRDGVEVADVSRDDGEEGAERD